MSPPSHAPGFDLRTLAALAWPVVLARSSQAVVGFCDALMTAPLGKAELAATTTGAMNAFSVVILPMGVVFIVQSFASQLHGRGELVAARRYAWYGLIVAAATAVVALALTAAVGPTLRLFAYEPAVHELMTDYLVIRLLAIGAIVGTEVLGNWYGGLGNTKLHMWAGVGTMTVNVFLNWVLITGNLGAPAMGVPGAAIASVVASWAGFGFIALAFARGWFGGGDTTGRLGLRARELWRMLRFGIPNGLNWFLEFAAFALFVNVVVAHLGTTVLAAMMVVININSVSFMPAFGISSAGAILTGQAIGSGRSELVPGIVRRTAAVTMTWQGLVGLCYFAFPTVLMRWFEPPGHVEGGDELLAIGAVLLAISAAWQVFDAVALTVGEALRSAGDTLWCLYARLLIAWLLFTPAAIVSVIVVDGGYVAAMLCVVGYLAVLAVAFVWRFRRGAWRAIDLTGVELLE